VVKTIRHPERRRINPFSFSLAATRAAVEGPSLFSRVVRAARNAIFLQGQPAALPFRIFPAVNSVIPSLFFCLILSAHATDQTNVGSDQTAPAPSGATSTTPAPKAKAKSTAKKQATTTQAQAAADAPPVQPGVTKLPTILVTAPTRVAQPVDTTATTTTVVTHQALDDNKYANVPDAIMSVPGLTVVPSGNPGQVTSVFIHGLDSRQTLVTVDGRRQAVGLSGTDDNFTNLTLDNIDQIEVVRTPVSSSQGGSAMGGVINLVTLSGKGLAPQGSVSEEAGSFNTFKESAQSRGQVGNFDYAVAASRQDSIYPALSPGYAPFFSPGFAGQADQYRKSNYRGNFGYQITPDIYVDLHSAYSNAYTNSPGIYLSPDPTASLLIEDWNISPEVVAKVADFYTTKLYYTRDQQRQSSNDPFLADQLIGFGSSPQGLQARLQINTDSVDWQNNFQIAHNWSITAGVQSDYINFYQNDNNIGRVLHGHETNMGGYVSSQWQPIDGLNVLNSARVDSYSAFGGSVSWRQSAAYRIAPTQTLVHASVSSAYTPPSIQDLYVYNAGNPFFNFGPYLPNPNLHPETDLGWETGVEQPFLDDRVTPSLTYFHNDIHNDIENVPLPNGAFINENAANATTEGVEVGLTLKPWTTVTLQGHYTYLNAVNDSTAMRLIRRPRNTVDFTGTWKPIDPLTLTLGGNWIVGREDLDALTGVQENAPDYFLLRASASYKINDHVEVWVRGENLTDRNYQPALGFLAPSIAGYGGVKLSF
jgi:vitamin B12 transporter